MKIQHAKANEIQHKQYSENNMLQLTPTLKKKKDLKNTTKHLRINTSNSSPKQNSRKHFLIHFMGPAFL